MSVLVEERLLAENPLVERLEHLRVQPTTMVVFGALLAFVVLAFGARRPTERAALGGEDEPAPAARPPGDDRW